MNQKTKELLEALLRIWENEEFVTEVLEGIDGSTSIADKLLMFMKDGPELVPAEVYDELSVLTAGKFMKEFPALRSAKKACIDCTEQSVWDRLFDELSHSMLFLVCEWKLTDEEKEKFMEADIGDTIHIDSQMKPLILKEANTDTTLIPVYTSEYEIPYQYRTDEFVIRPVDWGFVKLLFDACNRVMGDTVIVLDPDSDDFLKIT